MRHRWYFTILLSGLAGAALEAQEVAVKSNLLYDAALTLNAGVEVGIAPRWTLDVSGNYNGWTLSHRRSWRHWLVQPEARYWLCDRFAGHFVGMHVHGGKYNVGHLPNGIMLLGSNLSRLSDFRYEGWFVGAGVGYGYSWILSRRWNVEAEIGLGYAYTQFDRYRGRCGKRDRNNHVHHYVGPTKAALNLVYLF